MPVVRTDGPSVGRSRDYQIFRDGQITLAMGLCPRAHELDSYREYHPDWGLQVRLP